MDQKAGHYLHSGPSYDPLDESIRKIDLTAGEDLLKKEETTSKEEPNGNDFP